MREICDGERRIVAVSLFPTRGCYAFGEVLTIQKHAFRMPLSTDQSLPRLP